VNWEATVVTLASDLAILDVLLGKPFLGRFRCVNLVDYFAYVSGPPSGIF
jgi:hypothetical protein